MTLPYRKILLFLLILVVLLFVMNLWMDRETYPHFALQYGEAFDPRVKADVIIMGASHATHGIHPRYLETERIKVFNFAFNGAGPVFNLNWYRKVFQPSHARPSCVIYGVHWVMFDSQFLQRRFEQDSKYFPLKFFLGEFGDLRTFNTLLLNRFAFIRERRQIMPRLFKKKQPKDVYPVSRYYHGYIPFETRRDLDKPDLANPRIEPGQVKAFEELLNEFKREGIRVVFVQIPDYIPGRHSSTMESSMDLIKKIARERGIPLFDYETGKITEINYNRDYYVDWAHLNGKGSEVFSKVLRDDLEANGFYQNWFKAKDG